MDLTQFERLLYEDESATLDFKEGQYRFVKATDEEKSELLKDIIGFANAWKRSDAFILIGVREICGGKSEVVGIPETEHLADHSLQQFVNSLTNRPIQFGYETLIYDGKHVGIIRIDQQARPSYLKKDYGKLKANEVYIRHGSSTTLKPASPEEIAQMGQSTSPEQAQIRIEFADLEKEESVGQVIHYQTEYCQVPPRNKIPRFRAFDTPINKLSLALSTDLEDNKEYFRERAEYEFSMRLVRPVRLIIQNGKVPATNVRVELAVTSSNSIVVDSSDLPEKPRRESNMLAGLSKGIRRIRPAIEQSGSISIERKKDCFLIDVSGGQLQPGRKICSDVFYIGRRDSGDIEFDGQILADNLSVPQEFQLTAKMDVAQTELSVDELRALAPHDTEIDE